MICELEVKPALFGSVIFPPLFSRPVGVSLEAPVSAGLANDIEKDCMACFRLYTCKKSIVFHEVSAVSKCFLLLL